MSKTLKEFQELDGWSKSLDRFAEEAAQIEDCPKLRQAAENYLDAEDRFACIINMFGVEMGYGTT